MSLGSLGSDILEENETSLEGANYPDSKTEFLERLYK